MGVHVLQKVIDWRYGRILRISRVQAVANVVAYLVLITIPVLYGLPGQPRWVSLGLACVAFLLFIVELLALRKVQRTRATDR